MFQNTKNKQKHKENKLYLLYKQFKHIKLEFKIENTSMKIFKIFKIFQMIHKDNHLHQQNN